MHVYYQQLYDNINMISGAICNENILVCYSDAKRQSDMLGKSSYNIPGLHTNITRVQQVFTLEGKFQTTKATD